MIQAHVSNGIQNTFASNCINKSSSDVSEKGLLMSSPALWISPSSCSLSGKTPAIAFDTNVRSVAVVCSVIRPAVRWKMSVIWGLLRFYLDQKRCPVDNRCLTVAKPIPRLAPVMTIFFLRSKLFIRIKYNFLSS